MFRQLTEHRRPAPTPRDEALSELLRTYWTNFAKTWNPNGAGLPEWPTFDAAAPFVLHISSEATKAGRPPDEGGLKVLDDYFAWRRGAAAPAPVGR